MPRLEKPKENQCFWKASEPGFSDFSDFPQMENRDLGWTGLGLGSPKTLFSAKKHSFLLFLAISHYLGVSPGPPCGALLAPIGS